MTDDILSMTCAECRAILQDYLEGTVDWRTRERLDAHRINCSACDALVTDLIDISRNAANLPVLSPSHDLWAGIESRIGAEVIELPVHTGEMEVGRTPWRALAAATVLIAVTSAVTWTVAGRSTARITAAQPDSGFEVAMAGTVNARLTSGRTLEETYDGEIATLRQLVDERRADIDSVTLAVVERNLIVIDQAIAESKMALAQSPNSAFLLERLTDAYDSKLRTLRAIASIQPRG